MAPEFLCIKFEYLHFYHKMTTVLTEEDIKYFILLDENSALKRYPLDVLCRADFRIDHDVTSQQKSFTVPHFD